MENLRRLRGSATTKELAGAMGLHPNGVRRHLGQLEADGLVMRRRVNRGRGRPRDEWATTREGAAASTGGQDELATWLAGSLAEQGDLPGEFAESGRRIGCGLITRPSNDPIADLRDLFTSMGFDPEFETQDDGAVRCTLCKCAYRDAACSNPAVVCSLHRGITEGALDSVQPEANLRSWEPRDPRSAGCVAIIEGVTPKRGDPVALDTRR